MILGNICLRVSGRQERKEAFRLKREAGEKSCHKSIKKILKYVDKHWFVEDCRFTGKSRRLKIDFEIE